MAKPLIIVESPAKTRTLKAFLRNEYEVEASMGHVRDLPKHDLGVDTAHSFKPTYVTIPERRTVLSKLEAAASKADQVYLATDPDREGEAIAWHLVQALGLKGAKRIAFNEITRRAVEEALDHPHDLDEQLVDAQQARRVLDRLVGYKLSPLLWSKVKKNLSAGRVQSVAVRLICDREREIQAFVSEEYWSITAELTKLDEQKPFFAKLVEKDDKKLKPSSEDETNQILADLEGATYGVKDVTERAQKRNPAAPFITSTLQQEASRKLGFSNKKTMSTAQSLYEGIELGGEGHVGLITYMRTDSTRVAGEAIAQAREFIESEYGKNYLPSSPRQYKSKKSAQDAHEAIRPTSVFRKPDDLSGHLTKDQWALYKLIWQRFLASQMESASLKLTTADIAAKEYVFRATSTSVTFPGFMTLYTEGRDNGNGDEEGENRQLPKLGKGEVLRLLGLVPKQHWTEPPPRYNQATLVKTLEEKGIGRPSTYASIISTIQDREYVILHERKFMPTELGFTVTDLLVKHFPDVMDVQFTAGMETKLDKIEEGDLDWVNVLSEFWGPFQSSLESAKEHMESVKKPPRETDEKCPNCGKPLVIREGRFGPFLSCSGYPKCKTVVSKGLGEPCPMPGCGGTMVESGGRNYKCSNAPSCAYTSRANGDENGESASGAVTDQVCPNCGKPLVIRESKYGPFLSCSGYPKCKTIVSKGLGEPCPMPDCGGTMVESGGRNYKCSNAPSCAYTSRANGAAAEGSGGSSSGEATDQVCPKCGKPLLKRKGRYGEFLGCSGYPKCKTIVKIPKDEAPKVPA